MLWRLMFKLRFLWYGRSFKGIWTSTLCLIEVISFRLSCKIFQIQLGIMVSNNNTTSTIHEAKLEDMNSRKTTTVSILTCLLLWFWAMLKSGKEPPYLPRLCLWFWACDLITYIDKRTKREVRWDLPQYDPLNKHSKKHAHLRKTSLP